MRRAFLGEFEEVVLLVVAACPTDAYGVNVWEDVQQQTGRAITMSAVHTTLYRLEEKGYLSSVLGGATAERGGRRKRFFALTPLGVRALQDIQAVRDRLWQAIAPGKLQLILG
ncbi:transcriptional regulator, PadR-like family [Fibrella aestuarina BUZ 2]|uniref:Transcriptional regulator, PadR-like family n=1 Tax=Fibrella aestuarina BUZ 2 TaxID=1166018 RepID=I0K232_9BACT|nr:PadR family transcriptional regulator [Fibrella aestuarina]CCG98185.1 transcriptional regulator, PadR-like family [Fibrella aestuarina BUZ 2]